MMGLAASPSAIAAASAAPVQTGRSSWQRQRRGRPHNRAVHAVFRRRPSPWSFWALAFALLLKAALPLLAAASAGAQQRPLAEVCSVYGVATAAAAQAGGDGAPGHGGAPATHHGDACPLLALAAFGAAPDAVPTAPPAPAALGGAPAAGAAAAHPPDAAARWAMRLKHGPPAAA